MRRPVVTRHDPDRRGGRWERPYALHRRLSRLLSLIGEPVLQQRREQPSHRRTQIAIQLVRRGAACDASGEQLALPRVVELHVQLVLRAEAQDLAAHHQVGADPPARVDLALALAFLQVPSTRLQEDQHVLAGDHARLRQDLLHRGAHLVGEIGDVDPLLRGNLVAELQHSDDRRGGGEQQGEDHGARSPKIAVPTRTRVAPSSMAAS